MLNQQINEILKSIEISYLFARNLNHGISDAPYQWRLFEPTKFIYSFFSFNMLYDYDWEESLKSGRLKLDESRFASQKIFSFLEFIYLFKDHKQFIDVYRVFDDDLKIIERSKSIKPDGDINMTDKSFFFKIRKSLLSH